MRYFRSTRYQKIWRDLLEKESEIIVFDTETTGLETDAYIVQLAAQKIKLQANGEMIITDKMNVFIKPPIAMPPECTKVSGITDEMLSDKPSEKEIIEKIDNFFGKSIVVAYNSEFDALKMKYMYERCGKIFKPELVLDAMDMVRDFAKRLTNFKLGTVAKELGCDSGITFHDASEDVEATVRIMQVCLNNYLFNPEVSGYEKLEVKDIYFWKAKAHTENRININTNKGLVYFNTMYRYFASPGDVDLRYIDIDALETDVCKMADKTPRTLYKYR